LTGIQSIFDFQLKKQCLKEALIYESAHNGLKLISAALTKEISYFTGTARRGSYATF
jgi:hypothetical protein